jgi:hypothetical protein
VWNCDTRLVKWNVKRIVRIQEECIVTAREKETAIVEYKFCWENSYIGHFDVAISGFYCACTRQYWCGRACLGSCSIAISNWLKGWGIHGSESNPVLRLKNYVIPEYVESQLSRVWNIIKYDETLNVVAPASCRNRSIWVVQRVERKAAGFSRGPPSPTTLALGQRRVNRGRCKLPITNMFMSRRQHRIARIWHQRSLQEQNRWVHTESSWRGDYCRIRKRSPDCMHFSWGTTTI